MQMHKHVNTLALLCEVIFFSFAVNAQGFFPELNSIPSKKSVEQKAPEVSAPDKVTETNQDLLNEEIVDSEESAPSGEELENQSSDQSAPVVEEQQPLYSPRSDLQKERLFRIYLDNVNIPASPVPRMTVCTAAIKIHNQSSQPLQAFSADLTFAQQSIPLRAVSLAPNATLTQSVTLVGETCAALFGIPTMKISACQVGGLDMEQCKAKVFFDPPKLGF